MQRHADVIEVVLFMVTLTAQHVNGQFTACKNPPPGLDRLGRGVDITKLDLLPLDFTGHDGFKSRVIEYTCETGKTISINGVQYQLPDQVWSMDSIPGGWVSSDVQIFKNYKEVKNSMSLNVGGDLKIGRFGFSASYSYTRMQNTIANNSRYIERVSAFDSATRIDLMPYWSLAMSSVAKAFVEEKLSATFQENPAPYEEFIKYFGTHFFKSAKFGGIIMLHLETSSDYYRGKQERSVKVEVETLFLEILKAKGGYSGNTTKSDEQFQEMTTKTIRYYGGNTNLLKTSSLQDWQPTVNERPWLFSAELELISVLFTNGSTRESVEYAITNHLLQAYLKEMERLLRLQRGSWTAGLSTLDSLTKQVDIMKSARILEESTVENLGNQIEKQVIIPTWFVEQTQLCYQWYADGNRGQCGGGIAELLCGTPNAMTSYYLDNSDDRVGGCRMRWGITVTATIAGLTKCRYVSDGTLRVMQASVEEELIESCVPLSIAIQLTIVMTRTNGHMAASCHGDWSFRTLHRFGHRTCRCALTGTQMVTLGSVGQEQSGICVHKPINGRPGIETTQTVAQAVVG